MWAWTKTFGKTLYHAYRRWSADGGSLLAASVAYYTTLALFPLLLVLLSAMGFLLNATQRGQDAEKHILNAIGEQVSPALQAQVATLFVQVREKASVGGPVGLIALLVIVIALFTQIDAAFNRIWNVQAKPRGVWGSIKHIVRVRLRAFVMLVILTLMIGAVFISSMVLSTLQQSAGDSFAMSHRVVWSIQIAVSYALNVAVFALLYYSVPSAQVPWGAAFRGGVLAALIWEVGREVLAAVVIGQRYNNAYGIVGAFLAIMLWTYYAASVMLYGAEYVQTLSQHSVKKKSKASK
jgi:membrane protein